MAALALLGGCDFSQPAPNRAAATQTTAVQPHQRLLPLEGGRNFRDLGGYTTSDGRVVKWGMLYRSGSMYGLTKHDFAALQKLGIHTICDFRNAREQGAEPVPWPADYHPQVLTDTAESKGGALPDFATAKEARAAFTRMYPQMLDHYRPQYRQMFGELLAERVPLAFNCTAGKDRSGIAAALILTALGVPRKTIIGDYLLSNSYLDAAKLAASPSMKPFQDMKPEVLDVFLRVERPYIEAVFTAMDNHKGGADGYLKDELGLGEQERTRLRALYTQAAD